VRDISQYEKQYADAPFEPWQVKYRKQRLLDSLRNHPHRTILEVGCGLDPLYLHMADFEQLVIVEPGDSFYACAVEGALGQPKIHCVQGFLEEMTAELERHPFDFIVLSGLLQEVEDPRAILEAVHHLCSPETVVHVDVSNAHSFHRLLALEMGLIDSIYQKSDTQLRLQGHTTFDMDHLIQLTTSVGFKVLDQGSFFVKPFTHAQMDQLLKAGMLTERMLDGLYGMAKHLPELGSEIFLDVQKARE